MKTTSLSLLFVCVASVASAQLRPPEDFFHKGAQYYIFGDKKKAGNEIQMGLSFYPTNQELQQLAGLLKQEEKQQQQQQQQQSQQNSSEQQQQQDQKQSQSQNSQSQQQQKQDEQQAKEQQQEQQQQAQAKQDQQSKDQQKQDKDQEAQDQAEREAEKQREAAMMAAGEMTPQQAKKLLDAQKGNDEVLRLIPPDKPGQAKPRVTKNW